LARKCDFASGSHKSPLKIKRSKMQWNDREFEMKALQKAVEVSLKGRGTSLPENTPFALRSVHT
jgi:hypothetical protein